MWECNCFAVAMKRVSAPTGYYLRLIHFQMSAENSVTYHHTSPAKPLCSTPYLNLNSLSLFQEVVSPSRQIVLYSPEGKAWNTSRKKNEREYQATTTTAAIIIMGRAKKGIISLNLKIIDNSKIKTEGQVVPRTCWFDRSGTCFRNNVSEQVLFSKTLWVEILYENGKHDMLISYLQILKRN